MIRVVIGTLFVVAVAMFFALFAVQIAFGVEDTRNQVSDWCDNGTKFDDLDGPSFTVPDPPQGATWTLLIIKAGQVNTEILNPVPGVTYFPTNQQDVSHAILCYVESSSTTSTTTSTTSSTSTTSATTTTTAPTTTTSSSTTTTSPTSSTSTSLVSTSTTGGPSTTVTTPETTDTIETPVGAVPAGGGAMALQHLATASPVEDAAVLWLIAGGAALAAALSALAVLAWKAR